jgi:hypothetical protein
VAAAVAGLVLDVRFAMTPVWRHTSCLAPPITAMCLVAATLV